MEVTSKRQKSKPDLPTDQVPNSTETKKNTTEVSSHPSGASKETPVDPVQLTDPLLLNQVTVPTSLSTRQELIAHRMKGAKLHQFGDNQDQVDERVLFQAKRSQKKKRRIHNLTHHNQEDTPKGFRAESVEVKPNPVYTGFTPTMPPRNNSCDSKPRNKAISSVSRMTPQPQPDHHQQGPVRQPEKTEKTTADEDLPKVSRCSLPFKKFVGELPKKTAPSTEPTPTFTGATKSTDLGGIEPGKTADSSAKFLRKEKKRLKREEKKRKPEYSLSLSPQKPRKMDPIYGRPDPNKVHEVNEQETKDCKQSKHKKKPNHKMLTIFKDYILYYLGPTLVLNELYCSTIDDTPLFPQEVQLLSDLIRPMLDVHYTYEVADIKAVDAQCFDDLSELSFIQNLYSLKDNTYEDLKSCVVSYAIYYKEKILERLKQRRVAYPNYPPLDYDDTPCWYDDALVGDAVRDMRNGMLAGYQLTKWDQFTQGKGCKILFRNASFTLLLKHSQFMRDDLLNSLYNDERLYDSLDRFNCYLPVPKYIEHIYSQESMDRISILYFVDLTDARSFRTALSTWSTTTRTFTSYNHNERVNLQRYAERLERSNPKSCNELKAHLVGVIDPSNRPSRLVELELMNKSNVTHSQKQQKKDYNKEYVKKTNEKNKRYPKRE